MGRGPCVPPFLFREIPIKSVKFPFHRVYEFCFKIESKNLLVFRWFTDRKYPHTSS